MIYVLNLRAGRCIYLKILKHLEHPALRTPRTNRTDFFCRDPGFTKFKTRCKFLRNCFYGSFDFFLQWYWCKIKQVTGSTLCDQEQPELILMIFTPSAQHIDIVPVCTCLCASQANLHFSFLQTRIRIDESNLLIITSCSSAFSPQFPLFFRRPWQSEQQSNQVTHDFNTSWTTSTHRGLINDACSSTKPFDSRLCPILTFINTRWIPPCPLYMYMCLQRCRKKTISFLGTHHEPKRFDHSCSSTLRLMIRVITPYFTQSMTVNASWNHQRLMLTLFLHKSLWFRVMPPIFIFIPGDYSPLVLATLRKNWEIHEQEKHGDLSWTEAFNNLNSNRGYRRPGDWLQDIVVVDSRLVFLHESLRLRVISGLSLSPAAPCW